MLRVCIASIQNVERSLLLLVVSASDIPLRTIFSVLFSSAYSSMLQAVTNKHSLVHRRLCDLHCMVVGNCFCHFVVCTSSNRSIASGAWPVSNLSFLSKLLEKVVQRRLQAFLDSNQLMPSQQSAYRQYHSTETAVLNNIKSTMIFSWRLTVDLFLPCACST